jgi:hypothetical protein
MQNFALPGFSEPQVAETVIAGPSDASDVVRTCPMMGSRPSGMTFRQERGLSGGRRCQ